MGAKSAAGIGELICALMPPHDTYVEPFYGSGVIHARKGPAFQSIILDLDPSCVAIGAMRPRTTALLGCGLEYLAGLDVRRLGRVVIYADPPYVLATRGAARYRHDFTDEDHRRLAAALHRLDAAGAAVILSGYPSALYDELFAGWSTRSVQVMTRGGVRTETVWLNFEPGAAHLVTFAGRDRTDRQRIKRKAARWAAKFAGLPPAERQAVLAALLELDDSTVDGTDCERSSARPT